MNDNFNDQKEKLVSLSHEINLLRQQVSFLLRNEKPLGLLDLDVLMNRTHTIYDTLCAINLGENADDEDMDFDAEAFTNMLGAMIPEESEEPAEAPVEEPQEELVEMTQEAPQEEPVEEPRFEETEEQIVENEQEVEQNPVKEEPVSEAPVEDNPIKIGEEVPTKEAPLGDEFGFFFRFEDAQPSDNLDPTVPETLGDSLLQEDHSLAAKLQQNPVRDLRSVIGINDKFLFVNELFGGSMEKYNKSIDNLNDLKTLNGAMIYLNELKIELQWNSSNEAYRKLSDLVARKFE